MESYATTDQLAAWMLGPTKTATDLPDEDAAARLLLRASEVVEHYAIAGYATRTDGSIVDPDVAAWLADAACAQVEFWGLVSEEHAIAGVTTGTMSAGGVTHDMPAELAPRARLILDRAGLRSPGRPVTPRRDRRPLEQIGRVYG